MLLAYAWVLYMALFSGGRFIRATLESAGTDGFWHRKASHSPTPGEQQLQLQEDRSGGDGDGDCGCDGASVGRHIYALPQRYDPG